MKVPWALYCSYLSVVKDFNSDDVYRSLKESSLLVKYSPRNVDFRVKETLNSYNVSKFKNVPFVTWLEAEGIYGPYMHFRMGMHNTIYDGVDLIFVHMPLRKLIDRGIILGEKPESLYTSVKAVIHLNLPPGSIEEYSRLAWSNDMTRDQWILYLADNDVFNYQELLSGPEAEALFRAELKGNPRGNAEFSFVARKTFDKLAMELNDSNADPKVCAEWFKLFAAAREKAPAPLAQISGDETEPRPDGVNLGCVDPNEAFGKVKPLEEFASVKPDSDSKANP